MRGGGQCKIIDVGAGSKLRAKFFQNCYIVALEPLADQYIEQVPWCDLKDANEVISLPIEQQVPHLIDSADFIFSINVLDHCYEFKKSIENIFSYLKPNKTAFISFDCHSKVDDLHPIIVNEKISTEIIYDIGFIIGKMQRIAPYHRGIAKYALSYWLRKPA